MLADERTQRLGHIHRPRLTKRGASWVVGGGPLMHMPFTTAASCGLFVIRIHFSGWLYYLALVENPRGVNVVVLIASGRFC